MIDSDLAEEEKRKIPKNGNFTGFSMIADINGFTSLVAENELSGGIANFVSWSTRRRE